VSSHAISALHVPPILPFIVTSIACDFKSFVKHSSISTFKCQLGILLFALLFVKLNLYENREIFWGKILKHQKGTDYSSINIKEPKEKKRKYTKHTTAMHDALGE
jgi:hypothetical protein